MRKNLIIFVIFLFATILAKAQTANTIMRDVVNTYTTAKIISADFEMTSSQFNVKGNIVMNGNNFRILTDDFKCWYDGKNEWLYTNITGEVNLLEPAREEMEANNPYLAVMRYNTKYRAVLKSSTNFNYVVELISRNPYVDMTKVILTINKKNNQIMEAVATMIDDTKQTIKFSNYVMNANMPANTFVFDSKMVPSGTPIIDLR